jgi:hypothetical protein
MNDEQKCEHDWFRPMQPAATNVKQCRKCKGVTGISVPWLRYERPLGGTPHDEWEEHAARMDEEQDERLLRDSQSSAPEDTA